MMDPEAEHSINRSHEVFDALRKVGRCNWRDATVIAYGPDVYASVIWNHHRHEWDRLIPWARMQGL